ncbi:MFS transporter, partial [Streptomyces sp900116325]
EGTDRRAVFLLMEPLTLGARSLTFPGLRGHDQPGAQPSPSAGTWWKSPVAASIVLTAGTALLLAALALKNLTVLVPLTLIGLTVAILTLRHVTPAGTLSAGVGVGAGVVIRGLLCAVYFGSEAFLPLGLTELRGLSATEAGLGLSAGALAWVAGSAFQANRDGRTSTSSSGHVSSTMFGFAVLLGGVLLMALGILSASVPAFTSILGWTVGGTGMGIAFNAATTDTMEQAAGREGEVSAGLQLAQTLSTAVLGGIGGAAIALAHDHGAPMRTALLVIFALTSVLCVLGILLARRLRPGHLAGTLNT